ncbi:MAG: glycoside hydrolase family 13 protein [Gordonia sp. (in: high G+C Gram-positive bacteria)]
MTAQPISPADHTSVDHTSVGHATDADWWRHAVVYQIYPRSFADGNGDGIGDLAGIISRVDYLAALGVDAVWLSPFYPSALADGGYDVDDYRNVDPRIGTLEEFDELVDALHEVGIKLIVDIVPNHSSDRHEWFRAALAAGPGSAERDRYIFRDGLGADGSVPPADWQSVFGGPAWTRITERDGKPGQWYLHTFAKEQPDWNWSNPAVREDFLTTLRFWGDRGVDGFRVDVAHHLAKDLPAELPSEAELTRDGAYPPGKHPTTDRDEVHDIYAEWRAVFNSYDPPLTAVAEAWVPADRRVRYAQAGSLGQAFNFDLLRATWNADQFRGIITENLDLASQSGATSTWVFSNHDVVRHATRYGLVDSSGAVSDPDGKGWLLSGGTTPVEDRGLGARRARAVSLLALALPGSAYLYQGEELGLPEVADIPAEKRADPTYFRSAGTDVGRDGCRVPLPWTNDGPSFGFGGAGSHLPQPDWLGTFSVAVQEDRDDSTLWFYRRALALRAELPGGDDFEWIDSDANVIAFRRPGGWVSITNFGAEPIAAPPGQLLIASDTLARTDVIPPDITVWVQWRP